MYKETKRYNMQDSKYFNIACSSFSILLLLILNMLFKNAISAFNISLL